MTIEFHLVRPGKTCQFLIESAAFFRYRDHFNHRRGKQHTTFFEAARQEISFRDALDST